MKQHPNLHKTYEKYRNSLRLASYKLRRQEFIEKYSKTPDQEYEDWYGADMAGYIDARQWWEDQDKDEEFIKRAEDIDFFKPQAF